MSNHNERDSDQVRRPEQESQLPEVGLPKVEPEEAGRGARGEQGNVKGRTKPAWDRLALALGILLVSLLSFPLPVIDRTTIGWDIAKTIAPVLFGEPHADVIGYHSGLDVFRSCLSWLAEAPMGAIAANAWVGLANPLFWVGLIYLALGRYGRALAWGSVALLIGLAAPFLFCAMTSDRPHLHHVYSGYFLWMAGMILLTAVSGGVLLLARKGQAPWQHQGCRYFLRTAGVAVLGAAGAYFLFFNHPGNEEDRGAEAVVQLGGWVRRDHQAPGRPVVYVILIGLVRSDADLKPLAGLKHLRTLYLSDDTQVTDEGLKELAGLKHLQALDLGKTRVSDEGLKMVAGFEELESLRLDNTGVTDAGLKELAGLKRLRSLQLYGTKVTSAGVAELRKALVGCEIDADPRR